MYHQQLLTSGQTTALSVFPAMVFSSQAILSRPEMTALNSIKMHPVLFDAIYLDEFDWLFARLSIRLSRRGVVLLATNIVKIY